MLKIGFVGWRGMVGSVLMSRMGEEGDFKGFEPVFFTTSNVGDDPALHTGLAKDRPGFLRLGGLSRREDNQQ